MIIHGIIHNYFKSHLKIVGSNSFLFYSFTHVKEKAIQPWIEAGYEIFSIHGPEALKIEHLARITATSKSSFYHHFADMEIFREFLLQHHLERAEVISAKAKLCKSLDPDVLQLLADNKADILFNRQLRIYRQSIAFQLCFERAHSLVSNEFIHLWTEWIGMDAKPDVAANVFKVTTDLFYQRLTNENLTYEWLHTFIREIKTFLEEVIRSSGILHRLDY